MLKRKMILMVWLVAAEIHGLALTDNAQDCLAGEVTGRTTTTKAKKVYPACTFDPRVGPTTPKIGMPNPTFIKNHLSRSDDPDEICKKASERYADTEEGVNTALGPKSWGFFKEYMKFLVPTDVNKTLKCTAIVRSIQTPGQKKENMQTKIDQRDCRPDAYATTTIEYTYNGKAVMWEAYHLTNAVAAPPPDDEVR